MITEAILAALVAILVTPIKSSAKTASLSQNCTQGCSLNATLMGPPVCGADGFTYFNECLADCQGVAVATLDKSCIGHKRRLREMQSVDYQSTGIVPMNVVVQFQSDNFRFVSKRTFNGYDPQELSFRQSTPMKPPTNRRRLSALRITPEGFEYRADLGQVGSSDENVPPHEKRASMMATTSGRSLRIIGSDTRRAVKRRKAKKFPFRTVGSLDLGFSMGGCSGTVIGDSTVLTAAHCVYYQNRWNRVNAFSPARHRRKGKVENPYKLWQYSQVSIILDEWEDGEEPKYDVAVIRFKRKNGKSLGDTVGSAGLRHAKGSKNKQRLRMSRINGYPSDKALGEMWTSGKCKGTFKIQNSLSPMVLYKCDTSSGMSGAGILDNSGYVYGVHTGWQGDCNRGVLLRDEIYFWVKEWAKS